MTPEEREKALTIEVKTGTGRFAKKEIKKVSEAEWVDAQMKTLLDKVGSSAASNQPAWKSADAITSPAAKTAAQMELFAMYGMNTSCTYCHTPDGAPAGVARSADELLRTLPTGYHVPSGPAKTATAEATAAPPVATNPATGPSTATTTTTHTFTEPPNLIPPLATPEGRRWFANSVFDHNSHRALNCASCHAQAITSTLTSDVLMPDAASCTKCHHPGGPSQQAASNNCVTCHTYHDRTKEREPIKNRSVADLTKK
jgi:hypothetical protein